MLLCVLDDIKRTLNNCCTMQSPHHSEPHLLNMSFVTLPNAPSTFFMLALNSNAIHIELFRLPWHPHILTAPPAHHATVSGSFGTKHFISLPQSQSRTPVVHMSCGGTNTPFEKTPESRHLCSLYDQRTVYPMHWSQLLIMIKNYILVVCLAPDTLLVRKISKHSADGLVPLVLIQPSTDEPRLARGTMSCDSARKDKARPLLDLFHRSPLDAHLPLPESPWPLPQRARRGRQCLILHSGVLHFLGPNYLMCTLWKHPASSSSTLSTEIWDYSSDVFNGTVGAISSSASHHLRDR